ncbi:GNAT family N-acetyltransferase [Pseudonocardia sp.]|uniref:GNAT family N-acetyltransferase n=1 Tax=Pseudonocardia sp. TaxID=60912 RepID=UPI00345CE0AD
MWGCGYAGETTRVLASWAPSHDIAEIFAVVRPDNTRAAATVRRNGMERVGRPAHTSGSTCRCSVCATPTSTPPHRSPRYPRTRPPSDRTDRRQRATVAAVSGCRPDLAAEADLPPDPSAPRRNTGAEWRSERTNGRRPEVPGATSGPHK